MEEKITVREMNHNIVVPYLVTFVTELGRLVIYNNILSCDYNYILCNEMKIGVKLRPSKSKKIA